LIIINSKKLQKINKFENESPKQDITKVLKMKIHTINKNNSQSNNIHSSKCYTPSDNSVKNIIHLIITRFLIEFYHVKNFKTNTIYQKEYISNGIRVLKKYLLPSLENQSCQKFIWILTLGDKANITFVESKLNNKLPFEYHIMYQKDFKNYVRKITNGFDILITTSIDYDDMIYYDAVNDLRKAININKPMILYGYNRGVYYFEEFGNFFDFYMTYNNEGTMSIFHSLITVLNKVNDAYTISDMGGHNGIRKNLLENYKSFGIKNLDYEPAIFDGGDPKFVYVRQNYSCTYEEHRNLIKTLKLFNFNLTNFYGI